MLDAAERIEDLRVPPGNRLERLKGDRQGTLVHPHQRPMAHLLSLG